MRTLEVCENLRFAHEACLFHVVLNEFAQEHLKGYVSSNWVLDSPEDLAHTALANDLLKFITTSNPVADLWHTYRESGLGVRIHNEGNDTAKPYKDTHQIGAASFYDAFHLDLTSDTTLSDRDKIYNGEAFNGTF